MPASELSLHLTDAYRERVGRIHRTAEASARLMWDRGRQRDQPDLEAEHRRWLAAIVPATMSAQLQAVDASVGYLAAFLTSELDELVRVDPPAGDYVGVARDGRTLAEAYRSPLIAVLAALKRGDPLQRGLQLGLRRALLMIGLDVDHAARRSLQDAMITHERVDGYRRAVAGTCGACIGAAARTYGTGIRFPVHPNCRCVSEPVISGVRDRFPRPTGAALFAAMAIEEQDQALGPQAAELVRSGEISLEDLVGTSPQDTADDFISQAPVAALQ